MCHLCVSPCATDLVPLRYHRGSTGGLGILFSFPHRHCAISGLRLALVPGAHLQAELLAFGTSLSRSRDSLDATPAYSIAGNDLAHLLQRMMDAAGVAVRSIG